MASSSDMARSVADDPATNRSPWRAWLPYLIGLALYLAAMSGYAAWRTLQPGTVTDFDDFWKTATHVRQTGEIPFAFGLRNYLPAFKLLMIPVSWAPIQTSAGVFTLTSGGLLAGAIVMCERLTRGGRAPSPAFMTLLFGLLFPYLHDTLALGQVNIIALFFLVGAWFLYERRREWLAGAALGAAAIVKIFPAVVILYFVLRSRWRVVLASVATVAIVAIGLPPAIVGGFETRRVHREFFRIGTAEDSAYAVLTAATPPNGKYSNAALPISLRRLFSPTDSNPEGDKPLRVDIGSVGPERLLAMYVVIAGLVLVVSIGIGVRRRDDGGGHHRASITAERNEFAVWCCTMLLLSPLLRTHYLVFAMWPLSVLLAEIEATSGQGGLRRWWPLVGVTGWAAGLVALLSPAARAAGALWIATAVVWMAHLGVLRQTRPIGAQPHDVAGAGGLGVRPH